MPPNCTGLDPRDIKISDSGGVDLEAWCMDAGCWEDWNGLEEVTEVTEGLEWEEEIGRTSHTLKLQELGGLCRCWEAGWLVNVCASSFH